MNILQFGGLIINMDNVTNISLNDRSTRINICYMNQAETHINYDSEEAAKRAFTDMCEGVKRLCCSAEKHIDLKKGGEK